MFGTTTLKEIREKLDPHFVRDRRTISGLRAKTPEGKKVLEVLEPLIEVLRKVVQPPKKPRPAKKALTHPQPVHTPRDPLRRLVHLRRRRPRPEAEPHRRPQHVVRARPSPSTPATATATRSNTPSPSSTPPRPGRASSTAGPHGSRGTTRSRCTAIRRPASSRPPAEHVARSRSRNRSRCWRIAVGGFVQVGRWRSPARRPARRPGRPARSPAAGPAAGARRRAAGRA